MSDEARAPRRVVSVLPTLFTLGNLMLGWIAIVIVLRGGTGPAAICVLLAAVLDKLDGYVARATDSASDFGRELDSLADVFSFGVAPAAVSLWWGLHDMGRAGIGAAIAFFFAACGALRLARFNVLGPAVDKRWFVGLPIPMAAAVPMSIVIAHSLEADDWKVRIASRGTQWGFAVLLVACALLMVSKLRYFAFKETHIDKRRRLYFALGALVVLTALVAVPSITLPVLAIAYAAHGPVLRLLRQGSSRPVAP